MISCKKVLRIRCSALKKCSDEMLRFAQDPPEHDYDVALAKKLIYDFCVQFNVKLVFLLLFF